MNKQNSYNSQDEIEQIKNTVIHRVAVYALIIHLALIVAFAHLNIPTLAIANVFSVLAWGTGIYLIHRQQLSIAMRIFCIEVVCHSILVCATLGLDVGFQYYLWTISFIFLLDYQLNFKIALAASICLFTLFALMHSVFGHISYSYDYVQLVPHIYLMNIFIAGLPLTYTVAMMREMTISQRVKLTELAAKDDLTKLYNRRYAKQLLLDAHQQSIKNDTAMFIVMADIDFFKRINDTYGHNAGDTILVHVAQTITAQLAQHDLTARWGGEEFLIAISNTNQHQVHQKIEQLRQAIQSLTPIAEHSDLHVTMSFGVYHWQSHMSFDDALHQADTALYQSKDTGRNKITIAA